MHKGADRDVFRKKVFDDLLSYSTDVSTDTCN
jgi:hypothetical protein